jgi:hypothetical protein
MKKCFKSSTCPGVTACIFQEGAVPLGCRHLKVSKYFNKKVEIDGIRFDSKKEAMVYVKLKTLLGAGELTSLNRQVSFSFVHNGIKICTYRADFETIDKNGVRHLIDAKGFRTREYLIKKKLMKAFYGIDIEEY